MKQILILLAVVVISATAAHAEMVFDPVSGEHIFVNSQGKAYDTGRKIRGRTSEPDIINGEWDNRGNHYAPADPTGNTWRSDGAFMQKAAGGYINTQTGEFIPSTD